VRPPPPQDGDGQFSVGEVEAIISNLISMKKRVRDLKYVAMAAFVALILVCATMLAMTLIGNARASPLQTLSLAQGRRGSPCHETSI
jgi:hypothetical protein